MSRFSQTVRVVANPYHQLDHKGRPCGVVPVEPSTYGGHMGFVGAKVDPQRTKVLRKQEAGDIRSPIQDTVYEFSSAPVKVGKTAYYIDAIQSGALLPADEETARAAGMRTFMPVEQALAKAKSEAEAAFEREYGAGALKELGQQSDAEAARTAAHVAAKAAKEKAAAAKAAVAAAKRAEDEAKDAEATAAQVKRSADEAEAAERSKEAAGEKPEGSEPSEAKNDKPSRRGGRGHGKGESE